MWRLRLVDFCKDVTFETLLIRDLASRCYFEAFCA